MKKCIKCKKRFLETFFYKNRKHSDGLQCECKTCHSKGNMARRRVRGKEVRLILIAYKGSLCFHCKKVYPSICYDLHHLDPKKKSFHFNGYPALERSLKEADKCILLCANCHRIEHQRLRDTK